MTSEERFVSRLKAISHRYGKITALNNISLDIPVGRMTGFIGPDGVGKSTLLGLISGARSIQYGELEVLSGDMANKHFRNAITPRIAYMPQGLGKNLYASLSVFENLDFFGRLFAQPSAERKHRINDLLQSTGLDPFAKRPAGKLSGGMKQKLGLCCALIHDPDLLVLDEPTTGVDPLSRRQFWDLIRRIQDQRPQMSVLVATAYMDEAEDFDWLVAINEGRVLAKGSPQEIKSQTSTTSLESAFVALLPEEARHGHTALKLPAPLTTSETIIEAEGLTKLFGDFKAVDNVSFRISTGEIFGFVGPNGCGKTTTMKMLTGLLPPSSGQARLFAEQDTLHSLETRKRVGYMSQAFSLYSELTVMQNLSLHARLFHLPPENVSHRIETLLRSFGLSDHVDELTESLPLGVRQRLSLAVAIIHEPEILILDEPTSGVDPVARDRFWTILIDLSRNNGVTIFVSTHFINEAMRCDRLSFMDAGKVLITDTPANLIVAQNAETLEEAFIQFIKEARPPQPVVEYKLKDALETSQPEVRQAESSFRKSLRRLLAYTYRESVELWRDPIRLTIAFLGTAILMLILCYGISMDVEDLRYAALDRDKTPESRTYLEGFAGSRYFLEQPPLTNHADLDHRLQSNDIALAIEIPPNFGKDLLTVHKPKVSTWIDGAMPFRAEMIGGYVQGLHISYLLDLSRRTYGQTATIGSADIELRYRYNQDFRSIYAMAPSMIPFLLLFIPSILMALAVVREKELGSIINFYVTPVTRTEFLIGKQIPYIFISMVNFLILTAMAVFLFGIPVKGSFLTLALATLIYVIVTTGLGLLVSTFTRTQIAALVATSVITITPTIHFSGLLQPVSTLEGGGRIIGELWPTTYFLKISIGAFTKDLGFIALLPHLLALAVFIPVLATFSLLFLKKQGR